jgi:hypothetical protein
MRGIESIRPVSVGFVALMFFQLLGCSTSPSTPTAAQSEQNLQKLHESLFRDGAFKDPENCESCHAPPDTLPEEPPPA